MNTLEIVDYNGEAAIIFTPEMLSALGNPKEGDDLHIRPTLHGIELLQMTKKHVE